MTTAHVRSLLSFLAACGIAIDAGAEVDRTVILQTETGADARSVRAVDEGSPAHDAGATVATRGGSVTWHRTFADAIYTSAGIAGASGMATAATYWNAPIHVEAIPLDGDGTADWTHGPGTRFFVDAARDGSTIAAIDFDDGDSTAVISEWMPGSSTPLWSTTVHPCRSLTYQGWASRKPIAVSDDGSTIAVGIVMYVGTEQRGRILAFDTGSDTPTTDYLLPTGNIVAIDLTPDGSFIAAAGWPNVHVYDLAADAPRWSGPIFSGNDALSLSADGRYLAWGWSTFYLYEWTGAAYTPLWTSNPPGTVYVGQCAVSGDGSSLAIVWDNGNTTPNDMWLEMYALPSLDLAWTYDFVDALTGPGDGARRRESVDSPSRMLFDQAGGRLAIGGWGGRFPQIHVFDRTTPSPLLTFVTPGSMFDIDIVTDGAGDSRVTACGKNVHAGTGGRGGDHYAFLIPGGSVAVAEPSGGSLARITSVRPNPARGVGRLAFELPRSGRTSVTVYDATGRRVRGLIDARLSAGAHAIAWDGRDDAGGRVSPGVYVVDVATGGTRLTSKVTRID